MGLSVPSVEMQDVLATVRPNGIRRGISLSRRAENSPIVCRPVELKGFVRGVARLVTQDAQTLLLRHTLSLKHKLAFKPDQAGMRKIKWDGEAVDPSRIEPLL
jgi:hypothetical protein